MHILILKQYLVYTAMKRIILPSSAFILMTVAYGGCYYLLLGARDLAALHQPGPYEREQNFFAACEVVQRLPRVVARTIPAPPHLVHALALHTVVALAYGVKVERRIGSTTDYKQHSTC